MIISSNKTLSIFGIFSVSFLTSCSDFTYQHDIKEIPGLLTGSLVLPEESFDCYKEDALRGQAYVVYLESRLFFDLNEPDIILTLKSIQVEPGTSRDLIIHFAESPYSPPFNYDLKYDYIQLVTGDPLIEADGLVNEEQGVFILRIMNSKSEE